MHEDLEIILEQANLLKQSAERLTENLRRTGSPCNGTVAIVDSAMNEAFMAARHLQQTVDKYRSTFKPGRETNSFYVALNEHFSCSAASEVSAIALLQKKTRDAGVGSFQGRVIKIKAPMRHNYTNDQFAAAAATAQKWLGWSGGCGPNDSLAQESKASNHD